MHRGSQPHCQHSHNVVLVVNIHLSNPNLIVRLFVILFGKKERIKRTIATIKNFINVVLDFCSPNDAGKIRIRSCEIIRVLTTNIVGACGFAL